MESFDEEKTPLKIYKMSKEPKILKSKITLEPMMFGVTISTALGIFIHKNLFLERACLIDLNNSWETCFKSIGDNKTSIELEGQKIVSSILVGSSFFTGFTTSIMFMFLGPWSDKSGRRKPLILIPILGMMTSSAIMIIIQSFPSVSTSWVIYSRYLPIAFTGDFVLLMMASFSYLGDICFKTGRCATTLMGTNNGFMTLFMVLGCAMGPYLYRYVGFSGVYTICFILETSSFLYVLFVIKDINVATDKPKILDPNLPFEAVKCVFKKRSGNKRKIILMMMLIPCTNSMIDVAEISLNYLFLRNRFSWTELEYGYYLMLKIGMYTVGTFLIVSVLKNKLNMKDQNIGAMAGLSQLSSSIFFMMGQNSDIIYFSTLFVIFARGAMIVERPIVNKQIQANEQGKINSVTALFEKFISFIFTPLANYIYSNTLYWFPACYTSICIGASLVQFICYSFVTDTPADDDKDGNEENQNL